MKNTLIISLVFFFNFCYAQQSKVDSITIENHQNKSYKTTFRTANILLASGTSLILVGGCFLMNNSSKGSSWFFSDQQLYGFLFIAAGLIVDHISVPFYIVAHVKKRKMKVTPNIGYILPKSDYIPIASYGVTISF